MIFWQSVTSILALLSLPPLETLTYDPSLDPLALTLLTAPELPTDLPPETPALREAIRRQAIALGLLEPDGQVDELRHWLRWLRNAYGGPPLADLERFPPYDVAMTWLILNRQFRETLTARIVLERHHRAELSVVLEEAQRLYDIFDALRDAQRTSYNLTYRRTRLKQLWLLLGPEDYGAARLPCPIPWSGLRQIE
jgi:hypothetical protein